MSSDQIYSNFFFLPFIPFDSIFLGSPTNVNVHDASAQLKALLFGKAGRDSVAASPTPGINAYGM